MQRLIRSGLKLGMVGLLVSIAGGMSVGVVRHERFATIPGGWATALFGIGSATLLALFPLLSQKTAPRRWRWLFVVPAVMIAVRFYFPLFKRAVYKSDPWSDGTPANVLVADAVRAVETLRFVASAQEQVRIRTGRYASRREELAEFLPTAMADVVLTLKSEGIRWWSATAQVGPTSCRMMVGAPLGDLEDFQDGVPSCSQQPAVAVRSRVRRVPFSGQPVETRSGIDMRGVWLQHRGDVSRSGAVAGSTIPVRWNRRHSGELRTSVSVAGDQLLVGSHGNGEVASYRTTDGAMQWRIRAPNWLHHEPIIASDFVVYGFGNNEDFKDGRQIGFGSPPSGFDVVERATGQLRWRWLTSSTAMSAPVVSGSLVIGRERNGVVHAWDATTGREQWRQELPAPSYGPMTNPLLLDSVLAITSDPAKWAVLRVSDGKIIGQGDFPHAARKGAGHTSPAARGSTLVMNFNDEPAGLGSFQTWSRLFIGAEEASLSIAAVNWETKTTVWRARLSGVFRPTVGHFAGTPVLTDSAVIMPLPTIGEVASLSAETGVINWRARVFPARGSVSVHQGRVFSATTNKTWVVLDERTGKRLCEAPLRGPVDRAPLTITGATGILTLVDGLVVAAPLTDWFTCSTAVFDSAKDTPAKRASAKSAPGM
jgi:outer membrane protein assembly factor BamB